jgi:uncharacterized protein
MRITFDPAKREWTVRERSLDFCDAPKVILVWTPDQEIDGEECCHVISMRKANGREQARYLQRLGEG